MKRFLSDTHALLWFAGGQTRRLGPRARRAFAALGVATEIAVSVVTLWEVALLYDSGHIALPQGFSAWCDALESQPGFRIEPLLRGDVEEARAMRVLQDPHDRLIAGRAARLGVPLITADARIAEEGRITTVW